MSGGSFDYFYFKMEEVANQIFKDRTDNEKKLAELMKDLSVVMRAVEWYRSGDTGEKEFIEAWEVFERKWLK